MSRNQVLSVILLIIIAVLSSLIIISKGNVTQNRGDMYVIQSATDTLMIEGRHMGNVNLQKFINLAKKLPESALSSYNQDKDSICFTIRKKHYFYGADGGDYWLKTYKNIPIHITNDGFVAAIVEIDSVEYIHIPYQILACVASNVPSNIQTKKASSNSIQRDSLTTIKNKDILPSTNATVGKKIQVEGYVLKNVTDILSQHPNLSRKDQMKVLWRYAKNHWNYINDPNTNTDTWRSASETIENYYFVDGRCYSGDCDDFAILMASFARQIGYESRVVTAFKGSSGHAYAEFKDSSSSSWIPLDWNSDEFGGKPYDGIRYRIYTDL